MSNDSNNNKKSSDNRINNGKVEECNLGDEMNENQNKNIMNSSRRSPRLNKLGNLTEEGVHVPYLESRKELKSNINHGEK